MKNNYQSPNIELVAVVQEDIISTSITIELPWLPLEDDGKEI